MAFIIGDCNCLSGTEHSKFLCEDDDRIHDYEDNIGDFPGYYPFHPGHTDAIEATVTLSNARVVECPVVVPSPQEVEPSATVPIRISKRKRKAVVMCSPSAPELPKITLDKPTASPYSAPKVSPYSLDSPWTFGAKQPPPPSAEEVLKKVATSRLV